MSDQATDTDTDVDTQGGAGDGGSQADGSSAQGGDAGTGTDGLSTEDARKLRSEARALRQRLKAAEEELTKRKDSDLTEQQKLVQAKSTLEADNEQLGARVRDLSAQIAAARVGVRPEAVADAVKLLDWDEIDDPTDGKQVERALKELVKEKPWLSGRPDGLDGGNGRRSAPAGSTMNEIIRQAAGRT